MIWMVLKDVYESCVWSLTNVLMFLMWWAQQQTVPISPEIGCKTLEVWRCKWVCHIMTNGFGGGLKMGYAPKFTIVMITGNRD